MTVATGYLGKREFHGALAKHSPYWISPVLCVCCSRMVDNMCEVLDAICLRCYLDGWRPAA